MQGQLSILEETNYQPLTLSLLEVLVKTLALLEKVPDWKDKKVVLSGKQFDSSLRKDQVFLSGKTLKAPTVQTQEGIFKQSCESLPTLGVIDLNGNCLTQVGFYPKIESGFTLSDILMEEVGQEYFLSEDDQLFTQSSKSRQGQSQAQYCTTLKSSGAMKADDTFVMPKKAGCLKLVIQVV